MNSIFKLTMAGSMERFNLRLLQETVEAIDSACARRIGNVSRNTWITEAIQEKLSREVNTMRSKEESDTYE